MNLKDFVATSLSEIMEGVDAAQKKSHGKLINPDGFYQADHAPKTHFVSRNRGLIHMVEFDVAVTVESASEDKASAGIKVWSVAEAGGSTGSSDKTSNATRIRFNVPITLPMVRE